MTALKLAFKNLMGAGLRTWLNVIVLSFAFVVIIFYNGMLNGWDRQGKRDTKEWEIGEGQFWHPLYDRNDVFSITDAHGILGEKEKKLIDEGLLTPILITQANIYPQGRLHSIILKGIDPEQDILKLPTELLMNIDKQNKSTSMAIDSSGISEYAIIGKRMSKTLNLGKGDDVLLRWRDRNGTFDAVTLKIADVFRSDVPTIDNGQIWISLKSLQRMMNMADEATILVTASEGIQLDQENWVYKDKTFLLREFDQIIMSKRAGSMLMQVTLLLIALLAIFDTQVLSIFRRQKEIGTYIALGMTRQQVVGIFTIEGGTHSLLAALFGAIYGIPLFVWLNAKGISFGVDDMGITMAETIYPYYSLQLIIISTLLVIAAATIVSYLPARKISKMIPTDALKGKIQ